MGLTEANFDSFLTYDSLHKVKKGGKGVGRLTWLKVFDSIYIQSLFFDAGKIRIRSFDFVMDNENSIKKYKLEDGAGVTDIRTTVFLKNLKDGYSSKCPVKSELIVHKIIAHFLPIFIGGACPDIVVEDSDQTFNIPQIIEENTFNAVDDLFETEDSEKFRMRHLLLSKALVASQEHKIFFSAHDRVVTEHVINNQTGLSTYFQYEDNSVAYVGIVSSDYLDAKVSQERNHFDIELDRLKEIKKKSEARAKEYLKEPIDALIEQKAQTVTKVIDNFPRYKYLVKNPKDFARELPLNKRTEEEVYSEMSIHDFRESRDTKRDLSKVVGPDKDPDTIEDYENIFSSLVEKIGEQGKASLVEYVAKRKSIIDLLESRLGFEDKENKKKYKEEAIHKIICPLKVDSSQIKYGQHHLWLIDDRLAYYDFWASDQNISKYVESSECKERPDLALFQGSNLLHRSGTDQPVVIVEFKRPARDDYTDDENPVKQVYGYIRALKEGKINDKDGKLITSIKDDTPFFCYIVCDITPKMRRTLEEYGINQSLPGNRGFFGFNKSFGAYVEIIEYDQIVKDARLRHEAFFQELGIN